MGATGTACRRQLPAGLDCRSWAQRVLGASTARGWIRNLFPIAWARYASVLTRSGFCRQQVLERALPRHARKRCFRPAEGGLPAPRRDSSSSFEGGSAEWRVCAQRLRSGVHRTSCRPPPVALLPSLQMEIAGSRKKRAAQRSARPAGIPCGVSMRGGGRRGWIAPDVHVLTAACSWLAEAEQRLLSRFGVGLAFHLSLRTAGNKAAAAAAFQAALQEWLPGMREDRPHDRTAAPCTGLSLPLALAGQAGEGGLLHARHSQCLASWAGNAWMLGAQQGCTAVCHVEWSAPVPLSCACPAGAVVCLPRWHPCSALLAPAPLAA